MDLFEWGCPDMFDKLEFQGASRDPRGADNIVHFDGFVRVLPDIANPGNRLVVNRENIGRLTG